VINENAIKSYLLRAFPQARSIDIRRLGSGVQGSGFLVEVETPEGIVPYVVKTLLSEGLGHDYPSDRAAVFLLDLDEFKNLPRHVKAIDVFSEMEDGSIRSIGGGREYYLLMERGEGISYFEDLKSFAQKDRLGVLDRERIVAMAAYLAGIHSVKKDSPTLYRRKLRDTVGHGECLMGVFDTYPDGVLDDGTMSLIITKSIEWIIRLKPKYNRLSQIHGDFHPGNIWFKDATTDSGSTDAVDFILLDRSRGPWGEPADDVTALAINYIFFSLLNHGDVRGAYGEGFRLFFDEYITRTGDREITSVVAPFFAFRGAVIANPIFYPEVSPSQRESIFRFVLNVLDDEAFRYESVDAYLR